MSYVNLALSTKTSRAAAISSAIGASGNLLIYTGTIPTNPDTAPSGNTLLATLPCSATFGAAASGVLTANAITQANAVASGTAAWARLQTSGGVGIVDMDVGTSGASLNLNTTAIVSGGPVQVTSLTLTEA